jgi:hypothetical protein
MNMPNLFVALIEEWENIKAYIKFIFSEANNGG